MQTLIWIAFASFGYVFLRAFQQLNVVNGAYALVMITSMLMALGDVFLITSYARQGAPTVALVLTVGISSGLGCICAMWSRKRLTRK